MKNPTSTWNGHQEENRKWLTKGAVGRNRGHGDHRDRIAEHVLALGWESSSLTAAAQVDYRAAEQPNESDPANRKGGRPGTRTSSHSATDEIGELARTFNSMVAYLKEMAGVPRPSPKAI